MTAAWHRVDEIPDEGRVRIAFVGGRSVALTRHGDRQGDGCARPRGGRGARRGVAALGMIPVDRVTEGLSGPTVDVLPAAFRHRT
jgi:hypothetical protein